MEIFLIQLNHRIIVLIYIIPDKERREEGSKMCNEEREDLKTEEGDLDFPIVAIGASAGGLSAIEAFFSQMTSDSGMAFVVVQHLSPNHESMLSALIKRHTDMQTYDVVEGMIVEPNSVYIIPPNCEMAIQNGRLCLSKRSLQGPQLPIDFFFRSLARDQCERAICIVLSGTGTDGMMGLKAIKSVGGMAMAQDPESAEHKNMPLSAISTGLVDYVQLPEEMPAQLFAYTQRTLNQSLLMEATALKKEKSSLQTILDILHVKTGNNFSYYKQNTIYRRIERRLAVNRIERLDHYVQYLEQSQQEVEALFREFLIGVTEFFRDKEAFEYLKNRIIPNLFSEKTPGDSVRVWVPGCSTGEEAYSIAILLREYLEETQQHFNVQIFATDIDSQAIQQARSGEYPANIAANLSEDRLTKFFTRSLDGNRYQIIKKVRNMLIFAEQNVIVDPPFSRMDLITCRNLLIYFDGTLQEKVFHLFHYALKQDGILFLGNSETIGESAGIFTPIEKKYKFYQRKETFSNLTLKSKTSLFMKNVAISRIDSTRQPKSLSGIRALVENTLLQQYAPACVVINKRGEIVYIHGSTGKYLELPPGDVNMNILLMAREGLRLELNHAINKVITHKEPVKTQGLWVKESDEPCIINLSVSPIQDDTSALGLMMVIFEEVTPPEIEKTLQEVAVTSKYADVQNDRFMEMERELLNKEEYLQTTIEELETSNEELQSTNEELQSTNEELETSKEELQSVNEELVTVNAELAKNVDEVSRANNDINNLLSGTGVGTIFLDEKLKITRFTPVATKVINLIPNDIGRPISHIASNLVTYDRLDQDLQEVLDTLVPKAVEVQTDDGVWYLLRILPYRTFENVIEGVVITLIDISEHKQA